MKHLKRFNEGKGKRKAKILIDFCFIIILNS